MSKQQAENGTCEVYFVEEQKVAAVKRAMESDHIFTDLAAAFQALSDPTRAKIIFVLCREELCVCDIANLLGLSISAVSHQLALLRNLRLVKYRKEGRFAYYSLDDEHIRTLFEEGLAHVAEQAGVPA